VERARVLAAAASAVLPNADALARLLTREHGKVLWESQLDVRAGVNTYAYYCGLAERFATERVIEDHRGRIVEARRPMGVASVLVPWNFPSILCALMLAPILVAGNTAVVKPSPFAPLALVEMLHAIALALPAGVVNVVTSSHVEVGVAMTTHPLVRKVSFTGSTATGREILRQAAGTLKNCTMELGGNDPALVLASASIDERLVSELAKATFTSSGQICYGVKRIYVHRSKYAAFVSQFSEYVNETVVGPGLDPESTMGPVNNRPQYDRVRALVADARAQGATVRELGRRAASAVWDAGYFIAPTVITDVAHAADIVGCEQFGPAIPIMPFDDEDEAVRLANDSEYGLAASVWSDDVDHAFALGARIEAGSVFVNVHKLGASDVAMPFGGFKQSGIGRGHGFVALEEASELQVLARRDNL
jgi:aldehyde dehydrogenase